MLLAVLLTGAIAAMILGVEDKYVFRVHSKYGCTIDTAMERSHRLWPLGGAIADGQLVLGCAQEETIENMRIMCVCE